MRLLLQEGEQSAQTMRAISASLGYSSSLPAPSMVMYCRALSTERVLRRMNQAAVRRQQS